MSTIYIIDFAYLGQVQKTIAIHRFPEVRHVGIDYTRMPNDLIDDIAPEEDVISVRIFSAIPHSAHPFHHGANKIRGWFSTNPEFIRRGKKVPMYAEWGHLATRKKRIVVNDSILDQMAGDRGEISDGMRKRFLGKEINVDDEIQKGVDTRITMAMMDALFDAKIDHIVLVAADGDFIPVIDRIAAEGKKITIAAAIDPDRGLTIPSALSSRVDEFPDLVEIKEISSALIAMNREYDPAKVRRQFNRNNTERRSA